MVPRATAAYGLLVAAVLTAACADVEARKRQHFDNGSQYLARKQYQEAIVEFRNAVQQDERFGEARFKLAEAYVGAGTPELAYGEYIRAADLLPNRSDVQIKASRYLLMARQFQDARTRILRALEKDPRNVEAQIVLGTALAGLTDYEGAITEIEQAIQIDPTNSMSFTNLGLVRLAQGEHEAARKAFRDALALDPRSITALLALANFEWATGSLPAAEQHLKSGLAVDPKHTFINRALAAFYLASGRAREAEPYLKTLVEVTASASARFALADYYVRMQRPEDAKAILRRVRRQAVAFAEAEGRLAQIEYMAGQRSAAHEMLDAVLARYPNTAPALLIKARWLFVEGKREEALERANAAIHIEPKSIVARHLAGTIQTEMRDLDGAIASFTEVLRLNPRAAAAQLQLARLHLARGSADVATQLAERIAIEYPDNPEARLILARGLLARGELAAARPHLDRLRKAHPNSPAVHSALGALQALEQNLTAARQSYERALQLHSRWVDALTAITALDLKQQHVARARARIDAALRAEPANADLLELGARVYRADGDLAATERTLRRLIEVDPRSAVAYSQLGEVFAAQRRLDAARGEFEEMARSNPKHFPAQMMVATILHAQNRLSEAATQYEQILDSHAHAAVAANNLAWIYADSRENLDYALDLAKQAVEWLPNRAEAHDTMGWVYYRKGLPSLAVAPFERSVARAPENPTYHYHLGLAYAEAGDRDRGRRALETALKLNPRLNDAQRALDALRNASR